MSSFNLESPLIWVGSKRWQVPYIRPLWKAHESRRYVEPFCGGLSMALALEPALAVLNDANPYLINFYGWLQSGWVYRETDNIPNTKAMYYELRDEFNEKLSHETLDDAKRFYVLNRMGYKGLFRLNKQGKLNTPYGYRDGANGNIIGAPNYTAYQHVFRDWSFTTGAYHTVDVRPDDFLYLDPPYDTNFTSYTSSGFTWQEQEQVATWAAAHTGPVVLCNQATPRIVELYTKLGFKLHYANRIERMRSREMPQSREVIALRNLSYPHDSLF